MQKFGTLMLKIQQDAKNPTKFASKGVKCTIVYLRETEAANSKNPSIVLE